MALDPSDYSVPPEFRHHLTTGPTPLIDGKWATARVDKYNLDRIMERVNAINPYAPPSVPAEQPTRWSARIDSHLERFGELFESAFRWLTGTAMLDGLERHSVLIFFFISFAIFYVIPLLMARDLCRLWEHL